MTTPVELADDLVRERDAFLEELGRADHGSSMGRDLVGEWGARELIAHLGYWAGHAAEGIHIADQGGAAEREPEELDVDEINATVARIARGTDLATVQRRELASVEALLDRVRVMNPSLLAESMPEGDTLEAAVREDGPVHYREHADELRRVREGVGGG
ncbi:MAG: hypothetical protein ABIO99_00880 [Candidatus Limnocylindria bacterium]